MCNSSRRESAETPIESIFSTFKALLGHPPMTDFHFSKQAAATPLCTERLPSHKIASGSGQRKQHFSCHHFWEEVPTPCHTELAFAQC